MNEQTNVRPVKKNGYSNKTLHAKRALKRAQANARNAVYGVLSLQVKVSACNTRRGESKRELARLQKVP